MSAYNVNSMGYIVPAKSFNLLDVETSILNDAAGTTPMTYLCMPSGAADTNSTDTGSLSVITGLTIITSAGAETRTLPDGTSIGQLKGVMFGTDGGTVTLTITSAAAAEDVVTLAEAGQGFIVVWDGSL